MFPNRSWRRESCWKRLPRCKRTVGWYAAARAAKRIRRGDGMLLFPGEAEMYRGEEGFTLVDSPHGTILVCEGRCSRANRPLACRMFPLVMLLRPDGVENRDGCGGAIGLSAGTAGEKRPFAGFCRGSASGGESACAGRSAGGAFAAFDGHAGRIKGASGAVSREEGTCLRR